MTHSAMQGISDRAPHLASTGRWSCWAWQAATARGLGQWATQWQLAKRVAALKAQGGRLCSIQAGVRYGKHLAPGFVPQKTVSADSDSDWSNHTGPRCMSSASVEAWKTYGIGNQWRCFGATILHLRFLPTDSQFHEPEALGCAIKNPNVSCGQNITPSDKIH